MVELPILGVDDDDGDDDRVVVVAAAEFADDDVGTLLVLLEDCPKNSSQLESPDVKSSSDRLARGGGSNDVLMAGVGGGDGGFCLKEYGLLMLLFELLPVLPDRKSVV